MEKKKMALVTIALFALVATATAWSLGTTLTPTEFANIDLDKHNLNPTPTGTEIIGAGSGALYRANIEINTFEKISTTEYEETNKVLTPQVEIRKYINCRESGNTEQQCEATLKTELIQNAVQRIASEKESLKDQQTEAALFAQYANELQPGDITITTQEIENAITAK